LGKKSPHSFNPPLSVVGVQQYQQFNLCSVYGKMLTNMKFSMWKRKFTKWKFPFWFLFCWIVLMFRVYHVFTYCFRDLYFFFNSTCFSLIFVLCSLNFSFSDLTILSRVSSSWTILFSLPIFFFLPFNLLEISSIMDLVLAIWNSLSEISLSWIYLLGISSSKSCFASEISASKSYFEFENYVSKSYSTSRNYLISRFNSLHKQR